MEAVALRPQGAPGKKQHGKKGPEAEKPQLGPDLKVGVMRRVPVSSGRPAVGIGKLPHAATE